jgi:acyl carrier protein
MKEKIKAVMSRIFQLDEISDNISQQNCAKWDSMQHLNLVVELEETFGVEFEPEEIAEMKSLEKIEEILSEKQ